MPLSQIARPYARYWGPIREAVQRRVGTAGIFQAIREANASEAARLGIPEPALPPDMFRAVTELRSLAVKYRQSAIAQRNLSEAAPLTGNLVPQGIRARDLEDQAMFPQLQATYQLTHQLPNGETITEWRTVNRMQWLPDMTWGEVLSRVRQRAEEASLRTAAGQEGYPTGSIVSIDNVSAVVI